MMQPVNKGKFSLVFIPTFQCNARCDYCFERVKPVKAEKGFFRLFFQNARRLVEENDIRKLSVFWQGGEVLTMEPSSVYEAVDTAREVFAGCGCRVAHFLQTNLLLYDREWKDVFTDCFEGRVGSSLDYPNLYRKTDTISPEEYNEVWLDKHDDARRDGFDISVISLINRETVRAGADAFYSFYKNDVGVKGLQINFPFPTVSHRDCEEIDLKELGRFMEELYRVWVDDRRTLHILPFTALENAFQRHSFSVQCLWVYSCAHELCCVGPAGEVSQCDFWVSAYADYPFGKLGECTLTEALGSPNRKIFLERPARLFLETDCGDCSYWNICHGGCPIRAYAFTNDIFTKDHYCDIYKRLFSLVSEERPRIYEAKMALKEEANAG